MTDHVSTAEFSEAFYDAFQAARHFPAMGIAMTRDLLQRALSGHIALEDVTEVERRVVAACRAVASFLLEVVRATIGAGLTDAQLQAAAAMGNAVVPAREGDPPPLLDARTVLSTIQPVGYAAHVLPSTLHGANDYEGVFDVHQFSFNRSMAQQALQRLCPDEGATGEGDAFLTACRADAENALKRSAQRASAALDLLMGEADGGGDAAL